MKAFTKIIHPGQVNIGRTHKPHVYCQIKWDGKQLSITGVVGPKSNGDAIGGCGQIVMEFTGKDKRYGPPPEVTYAAGWTEAMWQQFIAVWDQWHLNDMQAGCKHQREMGWQSCPGHYGDGSETCSNKKEPKPITADDLPLGHPFVIGSKHLQGSSMYLKPESAPCAHCRQPYKDHLTAQAWEQHLKPKKHYHCTEDKLSKPCPVCGYKYGTQWLHEDVPANVLQFLADLPETESQPAWV